MRNPKRSSFIQKNALKSNLKNSNLRMSRMSQIYRAPLSPSPRVVEDPPESIQGFQKSIECRNNKNKFQNTQSYFINHQDGLDYFNYTKYSEDQTQIKSMKTNNNGLNMDLEFIPEILISPKHLDKATSTSASIDSEDAKENINTFYSDVW